jgi:hypothetical protein
MAVPPTLAQHIPPQMKKVADLKLRRYESGRHKAAPTQENTTVPQALPLRITQALR